MPTREEMQSLSQEILRSYEDRVRVIPELKQAESDRKRSEAQEIAQRKSAVGTMLKDFDDAHAAMSKELRSELTGDEQERRQTTAKEIAQRKSAVGTMLKDFDDAHAAMSKELRSELTGDEQERRQTTAKEIAQRKSAVGTMLKEFREEQAGVRAEWQKMTATMQAKRGAPVVEVKPPEAVVRPVVEVKPPEAVVRPVVEEVPPPPLAEEIAEEEAVARAEVAEVTPYLADLGERVFEHLAGHPDGTRLVELEQEFGIARIQMAKVVRNLMDGNKAEKRGTFYFAI